MTCELSRAAVQIANVILHIVSTAERNEARVISGCDRRSRTHAPTRSDHDWTATFRGSFSTLAPTVTVGCMTIPPAADATTGDPSPEQPGTRVLIGLLPIVIGVIGAITFQLHSIAVFGVMFFPAVGLIIAGVVTVGSAVGIAAVFRALTGRWRPVAAALLATFPALVVWLPVLGPVPMAYGALSALGPIVVGIVVGALAMLTMPGRWRLAGAISAAVVAVAALVPIAIELIA